MLIPSMHRNLAQISRWWVLKVTLNKSINDRPIQTLCTTSLPLPLNPTAVNRNLAILTDTIKNNTKNNLQYHHPITKPSSQLFEQQSDNKKKHRVHLPGLTIWNHPGHHPKVIFIVMMLSCTRLHQKEKLFVIEK